MESVLQGDASSQLFTSTANTSPSCRVCPLRSATCRIQILGRVATVLEDCASTRVDLCDATNPTTSRRQVVFLLRLQIPPDPYPKLLLLQATVLRFAAVAAFCMFKMWPRSAEWRKSESWAGMPGATYVVQAVGGAHSSESHTTNACPLSHALSGSCAAGTPSALTTPPLRGRGLSRSIK